MKQKIYYEGERTFVNGWRSIDKELFLPSVIKIRKGDIIKFGSYDNDLIRYWKVYKIYKHSGQVYWLGLELLKEGDNCKTLGEGYKLGYILCEQDDYWTKIPKLKWELIK